VSDLRAPNCGPVARRRRLALFLPLTALAFLAAGWTIFWFVARAKAETALNQWIAREETQGRKWTCGDRQIGGYPLNIEIACDLLAFSGDFAGKPTLARLKRAVVVAQLSTSRRINIEMTGPFEAERGDRRAELDWSSLKFYVRGLPERVERLTLSSRELRATLFSPTVAAFEGSIAGIHSSFRRDAHGAGAQATLDLTFVGVQSADLDRIAGGDTTPAALTWVATVSQFDKTTRGTWLERLELWRAAGGRLQLGLLAVQKGAASIQADGSLGLDQSHRLDGKIDMRLRSAGRMALNLGAYAGLLQPDAVTTQILATVLGRAGANAETRLDLSFLNGALGVGPLKGLVALPPFY
jgi:hypothetical protein